MWIKYFWCVIGISVCFSNSAIGAGYPPVSTNYLLYRVHADSNAQGLNVKMTYQDTDNPTDFTIYTYNQYGYLAYQSDTNPEFNNTNRPSLNDPYHGFSVLRLQQNAIDRYNSLKSMTNAGTDHPLTIEVALTNQHTTESQIVKIYIDGDLETTVELEANNDGTAYVLYQFEYLLDNSSDVSVSFEDNDGTILGSATAESGWQPAEWIYYFGTKKGQFIDYDLPDIYDNDIPEFPTTTDETGVGRVLPEEYDPPETDDTTAPEYNPDIPQDNESNPEQWEGDVQDNESIDNPETPSDNDDEVVNAQDFYNSMLKALNDSGQKYSGDDVPELDQPELDSEATLSLLDNTGDSLNQVIGDIAGGVNSLKDKVGEIHPIELPSGIGTTSTIDFYLPWDNDTNIVIDFEPFHDKILLCRNIIKYFLAITFWFLTIQIFRQGIS